MKTQEIQWLIRNLSPAKVAWQDFMDPAWYPVSRREWEAEQRAFEAVRRAMPWDSGLWARFRSAYKNAFHMQRGPTYDCASKMLARFLSLDPSFSDPDGAGVPEDLPTTPVGRNTRQLKDFLPAE